MTAPPPVRLALAGVGAWGRNLLRLALASPRAALVAVVDPSAEALAQASAMIGPGDRGARLCRSLDEALGLGLDALLVASPATTHATLARGALEAGLDVLVEKPLTTSAAEASALAALARRRGRVAMVGHLLRYHPAVRRLLSLVRQGAIGKPRMLLSSRLSPPGRPSDVSALWALGPHDLSVLQALDGSGLDELSALLTGDDWAFLQARLASGLGAQIALSRVHPRKERSLAVVGDEGTLLFDDLATASPLTLRRRDPACAPEPVPVQVAEPLALELDHFLACAAARSEPLTPFEDGARVVRWLEAAQRACPASLAWRQR